MRVFFPLLLCAALFPFSVQAEDAPLPFDVPSAAPVIQRSTVVSKPVAYPAATQAANAQQAKSQRSARSKHATRAKKPSATSVTKKQKGTRPTALAKKTKGARSPALVSKKTTKLSQKRSRAKPKATVHKKQPTKQPAHKKQPLAKKH